MRTARIASYIGSGVFGLALWLAVKHVFSIPDRYLPGLEAMGEAITDIGPDWWHHIGSTVARVVIGYSLGVILGLVIALCLYRLRLLAWTIPFFNGVRAVPAVAIVPFFLLWFGFSEFGKYLLVMTGFGFNVLIAAADRLLSPQEGDVVLFRNLQEPLNRRVLSYWLPRVLEGLLPTLRFGVALALGVVVVSEMLGAQWGLGYLMQSARGTFSLNVIVVAVLILGVIATLLDLALRVTWKRAVTWRK
jgi:ABC-type nitrate/sulfonate/bicarbonate transport system permease component